MTWADVAAAGAFVLGVATGVFMSTQVMRYVMIYLKRQEGEGEDG